MDAIVSTVEQRRTSNDLTEVQIAEKMGITRIHYRKVRSGEAPGLKYYRGVIHAFPDLRDFVIAVVFPQN